MIDDMDGADDVDCVEEHLLVFLPVFLILDFSAVFFTSSFKPHLPFLLSSFLVQVFFSPFFPALNYLSPTIPRHTSLKVMVVLMLANGLRCLSNSDFGEVLEWWVGRVVKWVDSVMGPLEMDGALDMLNMESLLELLVMDEGLEMLKAERLIKLWETKCFVELQRV